MYKIFYHSNYGAVKPNNYSKWALIIKEIINGSTIIIIDKTPKRSTRKPK